MKAPDIQFTNHLLDTAARVTLADLLECPATASDAISMVANICKYMTLYRDDMNSEDEKLELNIHRLNQSIRPEAREAAFAHLMDRRKHL